ncbi:MAG: hypothetical protein RIF37_03560 [Rhodospirillaceae bacterium]
MPFWRGEELASNLKGVILPFHANNIDCAAYTLHIGQEIYITPHDGDHDPQRKTIQKLDVGECFTIPPGQFGYLLTEEFVKMPDDTLAFISIKSKKGKFKGLINVSGFHVDPGYSGKLLFSVYNAGPSPIQLRQGDPFFLIWFASLVSPTKYKKSSSGFTNIPAELIDGIPGTVDSLQGVTKKISDQEKSIGERMNKLEAELSATKTLSISLIGALSTILTIIFGILTLISKSPS